MDHFIRGSIISRRKTCVYDSKGNLGILNDHKVYLIEYKYFLNGIPLIIIITKLNCIQQTVPDMIELKDHNS